MRLKWLGCEMNRATTFASMVIALAVISGCSAGIKDGGQGAVRISFSTSITYQEAYRRADAYARHCHTSNSLWKGSFNVGGDLYSDTGKGIVRINMPQAGRDLERIEISSTGPSSSDVAITAWGVGIWDEREMAAAEASILTGKPVCRKDIPS